MLVQNMAGLVVAREKNYGTNMQKMRRRAFLTPDLRCLGKLCLFRLFSSFNIGQKTT